MGAYAYANLVSRVLSSFDYFEDHPATPTKIDIPAISDPPFRWKEKFLLRDGKVLKVSDHNTYDSEGNVLERDFSYDFREAGALDPIFRVCNHDVKQSVDAPCHVHVGDQQINCFETSTRKDFEYAVHCIKNHYLGKRQDWEKGGSDGSNSEGTTL